MRDKPIRKVQPITVELVRLGSLLSSKGAVPGGGGVPPSGDDFMLKADGSSRMLKADGTSFMIKT